MDEDLNDLVKRWLPPAPRAGFEEAMLARFRRQTRWRRMLRARVAIPIPLLAASVLVFTLMTLFAWTLWRRTPELPGWEPVREPQLRVIRAGGVK
jgi:hypothetical protein